jgi:hypothetical protein
MEKIPANLPVICLQYLMGAINSAAGQKVKFILPRQIHFARRHARKVCGACNFSRAARATFFSRHRG